MVAGGDGGGSTGGSAKHRIAWVADDEVKGLGSLSPPIVKGSDINADAGLAGGDGDSAVGTGEVAALVGCAVAGVIGNADIHIGGFTQGDSEGGVVALGNFGSGAGNRHAGAVIYSGGFGVVKR